MNQPFNLFEKHLQQVKIKHLPSHRLILDIGCGDGSVFGNANTFGNSVICDAVDTDPTALNMAKAWPNYRKLSTSLRDFDPAEYDCVTILGTLEHMDEIEITYMLDYIKTAKAVYVTVPNANSFHRHVGVQMGIIKDVFELQDHDYNIGHKRYYDHNLLFKHLFPLYMNKFMTVASGSEGFKFDTSHNMIQYLSRIDAIERVAEDRGLIGEGNFMGAEIFVYLKK